MRTGTKLAGLRKIGKLKMTIKEIKFYLEDLPFYPDELEEAIHEELKEMDINFTKFSCKIIVEYETQENDDE